jgi:hypothetical protein
MNPLTKNKFKIILKKQNKNKKRIYHSTCGLDDPEISIVKTVSVCNKASASIGFFVIFDATENEKIIKKIFFSNWFFYF